MEEGMNHTTKAQRDEWIDKARSLVQLDTTGQCTNQNAVTHEIQEMFGISHNSARNATVHAILLTRGERLKKRMMSDDEVLAILSQDAIPGVTPFVLDGVTNEQVCLCVEGRLDGRRYGGSIAVMRERNVVGFASAALWAKARSWIEEHKNDS